MSASQLLRILKTLPAGADDEISSFNTEELEASMNRTSRCTNPFLSNDNDNQVNYWNNPELESSTFGNEFTNNHEQEMFRKSPAARNVHPHSDGFRIDKHSVECELPELMVCYKDKDSEFHVKDVCINEDKDNDHEFLYNSVNVNGDEDDDMIEANLDTEFLKHEWLRSSTMACCYMDVELGSCVHNETHHYGLDKPTNSCEEKFNLSTSLQDDISTDQLTSSSMISLQPNWSLTPSNIYEDDINQHPVQGSKAEVAKRAIVGSVAEKELEKDYQLKNVTNERKMESVVDQQELASGYKVAVKDHETRYVEGEASFSMAGVISELISCSRPMPFAGGISTRSDSSAASARSFAFPTLETEYTSSPARMGKSERKRLQRHTGWRKGLLCCKF
ncbi:hypothetical protein SSX86_016068 [Deinandra increscens subsp. villosa]|uniref:Uncharacterized protein n=1 Tax=Deinandra increscens subsp. villosa TaxID=3103831 RepID=A0AAP0CYY4_9ASTR